ncbi:hypothetical protein LCGC14_1187500 [marine sediment metagenome]|uniref:Sulfotransferase domain-containing protein n=1 Tax=marine sediment metagenome TaxID=412755 RepID=A0A0F9LQ68_9ZZZZ
MFMKANFVNMQKKGYFHPFAAGRHFALMNRIFDGQITADEAGLDIEARADSKEHPIHSVVLSDEDICMRRDLSPLAGLRDRFDVKVVFVLRRQDLWLESWYQQNVKWQWNPALAHLSFPEFFARRDEFFWIDYDAMMHKLGGLFGADNIICLSFERPQMPEGPVAAFCDAIGLTDRAGFAPAPHTNVSLSPLMTEFMRTLPLDEIPPKQRRVFEQACAEADKQITGQSGPQSTLFLDPESRAALMRDHAPGNAALARRLNRETLFTQPLPPADAPLAPQRLPQDSYALQRDFTGPFLRALAVRMGED